MGFGLANVTMVIKDGPRKSRPRLDPTHADLYGR